MTRGVAWAVAALGIVSACSGREAPAPRQPAPAAAAPATETARRDALSRAAAPAAAPAEDWPRPGPAEVPACGRERCAPHQVCEFRAKGHAVDAAGRPIRRYACIDAPAECASAPTCTCLRAHGVELSCVERDGLTFVSDER